MSELYPGSIQTPPMKYAAAASQSLLDTVMNSTEWVMSEKYDGAFYQLEKTNEGNIYLFGRTVSKKTGELTEKIANVPWLKQWAEQWLPNGTILLGEIYIPGGHSNNVTSIMGCLPQKAIERQKTVHVEYRLFDCIRWNGQDLCNEPFENRFNKIEALVGGNANDEDEHVKIVKMWRLPSEDWSFEPYLNEIFANGGEGAVFKRLDAIYEPGKRPPAHRGYFKCKEHIDAIDLVITRCLNPEKEYTGKEIDTWPYWIDGEAVTKHYYYGWKNAFELGAYDQEGKLIVVGKVASGLTDEMREAAGKNPEQFVGKVARISCMSVNKKDKTIRHPVFESIHEEKNPEECLIEEIF